MEITKESIDLFIEEFTRNKDNAKIKESYLSNFDKNNDFDKFNLEVLNGKGGYYVLFINNIIKKFKPRNIVELGNLYGMSTVSMYDAIKDVGGNMWSVDIIKDQRYCPDIMHKDDQVKFIYGDDCKYEIIKKLPTSIDFLYTDTLHMYEQILDEWEIYQHLLSDKALVAIDDIHLNDKWVLWDSIKYEKWDLTNLCHFSGWGLFLFERKEILTKEEKEKNLLEAVIKVWERKYDIYTRNNPVKISLKTKISEYLKTKKFVVSIYIIIKKMLYKIIKKEMPKRGSGY